MNGAVTTPPLLVLGNANIDLVLGEVDGWPAVGTEVVVERSEMRAGGSAGNTALALSGMGVPYRFIGSSGNDPNGTWLREQFDPSSCEWIIEHCDTTVTVGIVHKGGDRAFFTTPGHLSAARLDGLLSRLPASPAGPACAIVSGAFLMPDIAAGTARLLAVLKERGWLTAIDPGWPPKGWNETVRSLLAKWLPLTDFVLLNEEEAKGFSGSCDLDEAMRELSRRLEPGSTLVVKRGALGAEAHRDGRSFHASAPEVRVVDTVGAGDTFNAAFLAAIVAGEPLDSAVDKGVRIAARAISTFPRRYDGA